jgi:hypothetical protein
MRRSTASGSRELTKKTGSVVVAQSASSSRERNPSKLKVSRIEQIPLLEVVQYNVPIEHYLLPGPSKLSSL